jgi:hypothetical protein
LVHAAGVVHGGIDRMSKTRTHDEFGMPYVDFRSVLAPGIDVANRNGIGTEDVYPMVKGRQAGTLFGRPVILMREDRTHPPIVRAMAFPASEIVSQHTT